MSSAVGLDSFAMVGSAGIAALVGHVAFWVLLAYGWFWDELSGRGVLIYLLLWLVARIGLAYTNFGDAMFTPIIAVLDIALVLWIFKGDVRLT
jgi:hypothetical protein